MDTLAYSQLLLTRFQPPPASEILKAAERLSIEYLRHLLVVQKYVQEYGEDGHFKRIHLLLMTRAIDGFVIGSHLLRGGFYNASLTELRTIYDSLNLLQWLAVAEPALALYLSQDTAKILKEFTPQRVRNVLGRTPYETVYDFLLSYATHPFYTGKEFLLGVDATKPSLGEPPQPHYPTLDAVAASMLLVTYAHATHQFGTNFGFTPLVDPDRDLIGRMHREIDGFLFAAEKGMITHRTIRTVVMDFRQNFPRLFDKRHQAQQLAVYQHYANLRKMYREKQLPFPPPAEPLTASGKMRVASPPPPARQTPLGLSVATPHGTGGQVRPPMVQGRPAFPTPPAMPNANLLANFSRELDAATASAQASPGSTPVDPIFPALMALPQGDPNQPLPEPTGFDFEGGEMDAPPASDL